MKTSGDKRMVNLTFSFLFKTALFEHILKYIKKTWSFLVVHSQFTPNAGPNGFVK